MISSCCRNFYKAPSTTLLVLGNSNIGHAVAERGARLGHRVSVTTREEFSQNKTGGVISYLHTPQEEQTNSLFWKNLVKEKIPSQSHLLVLNTIGGSVAAPGQTMEELNVHIPAAAIEGALEGAGGKFDSCNVVHLSTSAAAHLDAPYGKTKRLGEEHLFAEPIDHLTIFRMSYVAEALFRKTVTQTYKEHHRLSAEEFALLPFTPLLGSPWDYKKVVLQPVSMGDIATAVFNTSALPKGKRLINAVGREEMTQEDFFKFFTDLLGKKFRPIYIPIESAEIMARHHPFGHCVPYAVEFCSKDRVGDSPKEFEELLGAPAKTLAEVYDAEGDEEAELVIPRPPLSAFAGQVVKNLWQNPKVLPATLKAAGPLSRSLFWNKEPPTLSFNERPESFRTYPWVSMSEEDFNEHSLNNRKL